MSEEEKDVIGEILKKADSSIAGVFAELNYAEFVAEQQIEMLEEDLGILKTKMHLLRTACDFNVRLPSHLSDLVLKESGDVSDITAERQVISQEEAEKRFPKLKDLAETKLRNMKESMDAKLAQRLKDSLEPEFFKEAIKPLFEYVNGKGCLDMVGGMAPEIGKNAFAIQPGTFEWALIQMKVGKDVRRPEWISGECLEKRNTFIIYCEPKCHRSSHWYPKCHDLTATDWQIVT